MPGGAADAARAAAVEGNSPAEAELSLMMAHKLDPVMGLILQHIEARAAQSLAAALATAAAVESAFHRVVLMSQRVKFTPFVMFHALRAAGGEAAARFASALASHVCAQVRRPLPLESVMCVPDVRCTGSCLPCCCAHRAL